MNLLWFKSEIIGQFIIIDQVISTEAAKMKLRLRLNKVNVKNEY